jgi:hypothetical protein
MINYLINTPFCLPSGKRFIEAGEVPFGRGFTNLIDTVCNVIAARYMLIHTIGELPKYEMYMGNDSLIITEKTKDLKNMAKFAKTTFGMDINASKSYWTRNRNNLYFIGFHNVMQDNNIENYRRKKSCTYGKRDISLLPHNS